MPRICFFFASELAPGTAELRASAGVACTDIATSAGEELVQRADRAMYRSKERAQVLPVLAEDAA